MKVLLVAPQPFFEWRGSPIRVAFDGQALAESGWRVDLLTLPVGETRRIPGVRVLRVPNLPRARGVPIGPSVVKLCFDVELLLWALRLARRERYDAVHGIEDAGVVAICAAAFAGGRAVFEKHSDAASYRGARGVKRFLLALYARVERWAARHAAACIGTGPGLAEQLRAMAPDTPVHHIPDVPSSLSEADPGRTAALRARLAPDGARLLSYVGSFAEYQGVHLLFEAFPEVHRAHPRTRLLIIGGTDAEIAQRRAEMAAAGVEQAVTFEGRVPPDALPNYLRASDILLSPRVAGRNTPLKLFDYLKAGRPIVATDHEAHRQILDAECAVLAPPTAPGLADGIGRLLRDPDLGRRLAARGARLYEEQFGYQRFKARLAECYAALHPGSPQPGASMTAVSAAAPE